MYQRRRLSDINHLRNLPGKPLHIACAHCIPTHGLPQSWALELELKMPSVARWQKWTTFSVYTLSPWEAPISEDSFFVGAVLSACDYPLLSGLSWSDSTLVTSPLGEDQATSLL